MTPITVTTTIDNREIAHRMARDLLGRRLVACVQISQIESLYVWDGQVQQEPEYRLLFKTTAENYAQVEQAIRDHHTYDLPAIYGMAIEQIYPPYAQWIIENCQPAI
jgi:periplasmic divalent cation tolerance protein